MSSEEITAEAMGLPLSKRVALAQALWNSLGEQLPEFDTDQALSEAIRRDEELSSGQVVARTHEQVMERARRVAGCG